MECYYHPERESTDTCAICGKSICKECGLEIAGKVYCKECLEKIVGLGIENKAPEQPEPVAAQEPVRTEPARLNKQPPAETIYQPQEETEPARLNKQAPAETIYQPQEEKAPITHEIKQISDDSPYNIKDNIDYSGGLESSYISENEPAPQVQVREEPRPEPQIAQNEYELYPEQQIAQKPVNNSQEFIYPDHTYEPEPTTARRELEDKYEKYLDDLYFDDKDVPLNEQLAKDEEQFGSLTRRPYPPRPEEAILKETPKRPETPEEMEARIRAEILAEKEGKTKGKDTDNIHNLNYQEEKESMSAVDILLTVLLIIVILIVIYYLIYVFVLHSFYPTYMDAIYGLSNPQNVINNILTPQPQV